MDIFAGGDFGGAALLVPVTADAEWTVGGCTAAGTDTVGIAVEDVRGEVSFDGPITESGFEGEE